jgi:hypothetical protein
VTRLLLRKDFETPQIGTKAAHGSRKGYRLHSAGFQTLRSLCWALSNVRRRSGATACCQRAHATITDLILKNVILGAQPRWLLIRDSSAWQASQVSLRFKWDPWQDSVNEMKVRARPRPIWGFHLAPIVSFAWLIQECRCALQGARSTRGESFKPDPGMGELDASKQNGLRRF